MRNNCSLCFFGRIVGNNEVYEIVSMKNCISFKSTLDIIISRPMKQFLIALICLIAMFVQTSATQLHDARTVVGSILAEPYLAMLASLLILIATLIWTSNIINILTISHPSYTPLRPQSPPEIGLLFKCSCSSKKAACKNASEVSAPAEAVLGKRAGELWGPSCCWRKLRRMRVM